MDDILVAKGEQPVQVLARYANRHGLVAGLAMAGVPNDKIQQRVKQMGRILELNDVRAGTRDVAFKLADDQGLPHS